MESFAVIIPVYNSSEILPVLSEKVITALQTITNEYKIIYVDDGSEDESWNTIRKLNKTHSRITGVLLKRNYGQHYAIRAGLEHVTADWYVVMDCDLQDNPEYIPEMFTKAKQTNINAVVAVRYTKKGRIYYKFSSWLINTFIAILLFRKMNYRTGNFGVYHKSVVQNICALSYKHFYFPVALRKSSRNIIELNVKHGERYAGKSTYTFTRHMKLAIQAIAFIFKKEKKERPVFEISETTK